MKKDFFYFKSFPQYLKFCLIIMITQQAESSTKHGMGDEDTIKLNIAIARESRGKVQNFILSTSSSSTTSYTIINFGTNDTYIWNTYQVIMYIVKRRKLCPGR